MSIGVDDVEAVRSTSHPNRTPSRGKQKVIASLQKAAEAAQRRGSYSRLKTAKMCPISLRASALNRWET